MGQSRRQRERVRQRDAASKGSATWRPFRAVRELRASAKTVAPLRNVTCDKQQQQQQHKSREQQQQQEQKQQQNAKVQSLMRKIRRNLSSPCQRGVISRKLRPGKRKRGIGMREGTGARVSESYPQAGPSQVWQLSPIGATPAAAADKQKYCSIKNQCHVGDHIKAAQISCLLLLLLPFASSPPPSLHLVLILLLAQISGSRRGRSCWQQESPHSLAATVSEAAPAAEVEADGEAEAVAGAVCDINWRLSKCLCACQKNAANTTQSRWAY